MIKGLQLGSFVDELGDYRILPSRSIAPIAVALPLIEVGAGVLFFVPGARREAVWVMLALLFVFSVAVAYTMSTGRREISCACFGGASQTLSWSVVGRNALLAAAVGLVAVDPNAQPAVVGFVVIGLAGTFAAILVEALRLRNLVQAS